MSSRLISRRWEFNSADLWRVAVQALLNGIAAALTFLITWVSDNNIGVEWSLVIIAVLNILLNAVRRWIGNYTSRTTDD